MSVETRIVCDAPDCDEILVWETGPEGYPWFAATLTVAGPAGPCGNCGDDWTWSSDGVKVDACSREHLRIAIAVKIADLTDESAPT